MSPRHSARAPQPALGYAFPACSALHSLGAGAFSLSLAPPPRRRASRSALGRPPRASARVPGVPASRATRGARSSLTRHPHASCFPGESAASSQARNRMTLKPIETTEYGQKRRRQAPCAVFELQSTEQRWLKSQPYFLACGQQNRGAKSLLLFPLPRRKVRRGNYGRRAHTLQRRASLPLQTPEGTARARLQATPGF